MRKLSLALAAVVLVALPTHAARAFCGFYVSGADGSLYANATMVVLMREGTRTVLSMQNNYQGPPQDFAMVVPVPVVLQQENVKTLPREIFQRVDSLAAPRLVEYWEQDPCQPPIDSLRMPMAAPSAAMEGAAPRSDERLGVRVEAQFTVGEYDIVILSASDSNGLDTWLRRERYNIPRGAEAVLRPYVAQGTKFFVAKVDVERVTFRNGQAVLSPLRFHYDTPEFSLPVRLGLLNSSGTQDLIVHVLAPNQRYEVANYANTTIPTNLRVSNEVRSRFGAFYEALFARTVESHPRTVVTEYAWDSSSCDPCPVDPLNPGEVETLGGDVIPSVQPYGLTLTRLHYRYGRDDLGEDLVFRAAPPIVGGRGVPDTNGKIPQEVQPDGYNNFQGRYVILHPWEGAISCSEPRRGIWGGPIGGSEPRALAASNGALSGAAPRAVAHLESFLVDPVPELAVTRPEAPEPTSHARTRRHGCASCAVGAGERELAWPSLAVLSLLAAALGRVLRRRGR